MKRHKLILTGITVFIGFSCLAQHAGFRFRRPLILDSGQWHSLTLPLDVYGAIKTDLSDLRILGISKAGDTLEAPYLFSGSSKDRSSKEIKFEILNKSYNSDGYYYTFKLSSAVTINTIELQFDLKPFDSKASLEGSEDGKQWFTLLQDQRIGSVLINDSLYRYTSLEFEPSRYTHYRLCIKAIETPGFLGASIQGRPINVVSKWQHKVKAIHNEGQKTPHHTITTLLFDQVLPIDRIIPKVANTFDYYRPISIYCAIDSTLSNGIYVYDYQLVNSGLINSWGKNEFTFDEVFAQRMLIDIDNGDNEPLTLEVPEVSGSVTTLTFRSSQQANYYLYYGNPQIGRADYELTYLQERIPATIKTAKIGQVEDLRKPIKSRSPLDLSTTWLWAVIGIIMITLGGFTVNMWRNKA